jgi:signal transduction histidine kinase
MNIFRKLVNPVQKIYTHPYRLRILLFIIFALAALAVSCVLLALSLGKPYMGVKVFWTGTGWVVESVETYGVASHGGIIKGDRLVIINGQPADNYLEKNKSNGVVSGRFFKELSVVDNTGVQKSVTLAGSTLPWQSVIEQLMWVLLCLIFWLTGFYVFFKKPQNVAALLFGLCSLDFGLVLSATLSSSAGILGSARISVAATAFAPWLLLHFLHVLPAERTQLRISTKKNIFYIIPVVTMIIFLFFGYNNGEPVEWFTTLIFVEYGIGLILVLSIAVFNYMRYISPRTRQQMKIIMISTLFALLPLIVLVTIPQTISGKPISNIGIIFLAFIPLGFGYAVITQKLLDIDVIIRRSVIYTLVTLCMAAVLSLGIFVVLRYESALGSVGKILIAAGIGLVASILFGPVKKGIELLVDRFFYKDRYDYHQIINSLSASLNTLNKFSDISRVIISTMVDTLNIAGACLFVYAGDSLETSNSQGSLSNKGEQKKLISIISQAGAIAKFPDSASGLNPELAFIVPLQVAEKEIGLLCLSHKNSRQKYTSDDIYLIQGIMSVSAIALNGAMLLRDAGVGNAFIDVVSDRIRTPISNIIGYTDFLLRRDPPKETREQWLKNIIENGHQIVETVDKLINIRRIRLKKVDIKLKSVNVFDIITEELATVRTNTEKHEFINNIAPELPSALVDREKFGQIIGALLDNAVKYSPGGGKITLSAQHDTGRRCIIVAVSDEGTGINSAGKDSIFKLFNPGQIPPIGGAKSSGLSLFIAKEWVEGMGGEIWLESELNQGSTFFVSVPAQVDRQKR